MKLEWTGVDSSNVKAIAYDRDEKVLGVRFHSGGEYHYADVEEALFASFLTADSPGKFFHGRVKGRAFTKISG